MEQVKRANWSSQLAFVLAASASAIGLGNLWRFPYLAARYGGGTFLFIYVALVTTLGFALLVTEIAIGRMTRQSQLTAYSRLRRGWGAMGAVTTLVPAIVLPYYCVIGGWVLKYLAVYAQMAFTGATPMGEAAVRSSEFFGAFIGSSAEPFAYGAAFTVLCAGVILFGVKNGIEKSNLVLMPLLLGMAVAISIYVFFLPGSLDGVKYYLVPNMDCLAGPDGRFSAALLGKTLLGAMGQMFFSLSIAMGIMVTYGSYMKPGDSIERSVRRIEMFDTAVAVLAGLMIIPIVYMFAVKTGVPVKEALDAGPGLMFITLPKVFATFGAAGGWLGLAFFALVAFAAATSGISVFEACVAATCDVVRVRRRTATLLVGGAAVALSALPALGYGVWADVKVFGQPMLDFMDFTANSVLMPLVAIGTCVLAGWVLKPETIISECERDGGVFRAKRKYAFIIRYLAPLLVLAVLASEICRSLGIGGWSI